MDVSPGTTGDGDEPTIGARLRVLRRERGLSQEGLAERAELSVDLIAKLEQDRRTTCRIDSLRRLTDALGVPVGDLIGGRERSGTEPDGERLGGALPLPSWAVRLRVERRTRGWSERETARRLLRAAGVQRGRPDLDRFGLTVTASSEYVWLDTPSNVIGRSSTLSA